MEKLKRFQPVRIVLFAILAAVTYGILHDMVTAHICVEYFTIAHPPLYLSDSPIILALAWGVIATWWVGAILGVALAVAARLGRLPKVDFSELMRPIILLMMASGLAAALAFAVGGILFAIEAIGIHSIWADVIEPEKHMAFVAVAWAHTVSYIVGGVGGVFLIVQTIRKRMATKPAESNYQ